MATPIQAPEPPQDHSNDAMTRPTHNTPSVIHELQTILGPLLLAYDSDLTQSPPPKPTWTGTFALFSFPRELRDRIYFHYLASIPIIRFHRRRPNRRFPFTDPLEQPLVALFLTSRQVHIEAYEVFCRYTPVSLGGYATGGSGDDKRLLGTIRLFPNQLGHMLQCIRGEYQTRWSTRHPFGPGQVFIQILRDAWVVKECFPRLRQFVARFATRGDSWVVDGMRVGGRTRGEEESVDLWLEWMRGRVRQGGVVPARWVRFELLNVDFGAGLGEQQGAMDEAYDRLLRETKHATGQ